MSARITLKSLAAEIAAEREANAEFRAQVAMVAGLIGTEQAKVAPEAPAEQPKADAKPAKAPKALTKAQRRAWNSKITSLAAHGRKAGTCKALMERWSEAQALRDAGKTPAQALKAMGFKA